MLDDYKELEIYTYFKNLKNYSHAYLFEVDDLENSLKIIKAFAKYIICLNHFSNQDNCNNCNICHLIDNNAYADLKIIEPIGSFIRKEQIQELQKELSLKSSNNTNQVYIIKEADKMNLNATNSLLKFLEEPSPGIHGILITTNKNNLLDTIISRCQIISLNNKKEIIYQEEDIKNILKFINLIHLKKEATIAYLKSDLLNNYKEKDLVIKALSIMEEVIDKEINSRYQLTTPNFNFYDIINTSLKDIELNDLIFYLEKIIIFRNKLKINPNLNLNSFLDRLVIEMSRVVIK